MNHKNDCDRSSFHYSGTGYNRVKVCACGAKNPAPMMRDCDELELDAFREIQRRFPPHT